MAEEIKTPEVKAPAEAPAINEDKLAAAIARGLAEDRKALRQNEERADSAPAPVYTPPPLPRMVSDDEIEAAVDAGDKTKARDLRREQRLAEQARLNREVDQKMAPGLAAINQLSESTVKDDPYFKKYERDIRNRMREFQAANPGALITGEHWRAALNLVKGEHADEIADERHEERVRQAREQAAAPAPTGRDLGGEPEEKEYETLTEAYGAGFKQRFAEKQRSIGGRSEDEEINTFDKWFRSKMPNDYTKMVDGKPSKAKKIATVKDYIAEAREIEAIAAEDPSLGLGS